MKYFHWIRLGIITVLLYIATIIIYMKCYYSPFKPIEIPEGISDTSLYSTLTETNQLLKSINRDDLIFFFILTLFICFIVSLVISIIYEEIIMFNRPLNEVNATLKLKETGMNITGDHRGFSAVGYNYVLIFETDNGVEMKFPVTPKQYIIVCEGNRGVLKYKQGYVNRFICFDIKSIT